MNNNNLMLVPLSHYRKWLIPFQDEKTREFIQRAKLLHGDKYDYRFVKYVKNNEKVCINCLIHGNFWQTPSNHLHHSCPKCGLKAIGDSKRDTKESFIKKAKNIHGDKYDYSKVEYINSDTKVCIICPKHGEFWHLPKDHLGNKFGCPKCGKESSDKLRASNSKDFISKAIKVHGDKYDYSRVEYINCHTKICIICPKHGEFWQIPSEHLNGRGCKKCGDELRGLNQRLSKEEFIIRSKNIHDNKYDYSRVEYVNSETKVCIICPEHGEFWQIAHSHLQGYGCPHCNIYKCEFYVKSWLIEYNISFLQQESVDVLKTVRNARVDFIINHNNEQIWVEYNGIQHYRYIEFFHEYNLDNFKAQLNRDEKIRSYCHINSIKLIEIPYIFKTKNSIGEFLYKVLLQNIDPNTLVDYESLFERPSDYIPYSEYKDIE